MPRGEAVRMIRSKFASSGAENFSICGVIIPPGQTALTRNRSAVYSTASARVSPIRPCLAAQ